jgi:hypothetical protein
MKAQLLQQGRLPRNVRPFSAAASRGTLRSSSSAVTRATKAVIFDMDGVLCASEGLSRMYVLQLLLGLLLAQQQQQQQQHSSSSSMVL